MSMEGAKKYNPQDLPPIKGQEGRVESKAKAFDMASIQNMHEVTAVALDRYLTNGDEGSIDVARSAHLAKEGITPEYVRALGEYSAESAGVVYDYEQEIIEKTTPQLEEDIRSFSEELLLTEKRSMGEPRASMERYSGLPTGPVSNSTKIDVTTKGGPDRAYIGAATYSTYSKEFVEYERLRRLASKRTVALQELRRRQSFKERK